MFTKILVSIFGVFFFLYGSSLFLNQLDQTSEAIKGIPSIDKLQKASGQLVSVSTCSTGKRARFIYTFSTPEKIVNAHFSCPSSLRDKMNASIGMPVTALYRMHTGILFEEEMEVYDIRTAENIFVDYQSRKQNIENRRILLISLNLFLLLLSLGLLFVCYKLFREVIFSKKLIQVDSNSKVLP